MPSPASIEPGDRAGSWIVRADEREQSHVDLADPTRLHFDYVRRTADLLDGLPSGPLRVLHVGGAGLTLPRWLAAVRPGSRQVVLEPDADVVDLVRERLPLPPRSGIRVRVQDGRTGLAGLRDGWAQAVVVDAFADAVVPASLTTLEACADVRRVLAPAGLLVLNLVDRAPFRAARDVVAALRGADLAPVRAGAETATLRGRREGNLLLLAGAVPMPSAGADYRWLGADEVADRLGGGTAARDPT